MTPAEDRGGRPAAPIRLFIRMNPPWVFIDEIRRFVESFCSCASLGPDREAQIALAVHELMQNAVPHARGADVELDLEVDPKAGKITARVTNDCPDEECRALQERVAAMYREPDALRDYLRTMKEQPSTARGGLGLARVRFEAQMDIQVRRTTADRVTVEAEGPIRAPSLATLAGSRHV
jgi:anti-sigma regulatory factor (Ser/Thr protein kinase)